MKRKPALPKQPERPKPPYVLGPHAEDLFDWGGGLDRLRVPNVSDPEAAGPPLLSVAGPIGSDRRAFDERWFEELCDADQALQTLLQEVAKNGQYEKRLPEIQHHVERIFEEQLLRAIAETFFNASPEIAKYFAARTAHRKQFPEQQDDVSAPNAAHRKPPPESFGDGDANK